MSPPQLPVQGAGRRCLPRDTHAACARLQRPDRIRDAVRHNLKFGISVIDVFDALDADADGYISWPEWQAGIRRLGVSADEASLVSVPRRSAFPRCSLTCVRPLSFPSEACLLDY